MCFLHVAKSKDRKSIKDRSYLMTSRKLGSLVSIRLILWISIEYVFGLARSCVVLRSHARRPRSWFLLYQTHPHLTYFSNCLPARDTSCEKSRPKLHDCWAEKWIKTHTTRSPESAQQFSFSHRKCGPPIKLAK